MSLQSPPFALYYAGDAYSTANKVMGRQSAGKSLLTGMARTWPAGDIAGAGPAAGGGNALLGQLAADGFTGKVSWARTPAWKLLRERGTLYYPALPSWDVAAIRAGRDPGGFSVMGVTHTLSTTAALQQVANLVMPPFEAWDALICTSTVAHQLVSSLLERTRAYWRETTGASRFAAVQLPVIPLGVNAPAHARQQERRMAARRALSIPDDAVAILSAGRLSFHAKGNPAPLYQALEALAGPVPLVCVEAGIYPNAAIRDAYHAAQRALAPSVRFLHIDGAQAGAYADVWQIADIFVSLSDNIQETFGLTPVEAMAAGLPVIVSDWNGYRDTVRHGIDGYRIRSILPPAGAGADMAVKHAIGAETYDFFIGNASLSTVIDPVELREALRSLTQDGERRQQMGMAAVAHARSTFDWPVILGRYADLARELGDIRRRGAGASSIPWPAHDDPFRLFSHYSTEILTGDQIVCAHGDAADRLKVLRALSMANFGLSAGLFSEDLPDKLLSELTEERAVNDLLARSGERVSAAAVRALMWMWKFDVVRISPRTQSS